MTDKILDKVQKAARYTGGEYGSIIKDPKKVKVRFAFCFPDLYEVGMSHLGIKILYHLYNEQKDTWCERVFMPWSDMEAQMRENNIPLFALESGNAIRDFDFVGFTLQYEMCYTNVLAMLDLAQIPLHSSERDDSFPLICAGGPCAYNPEPLADFIDFFIIGEGEEVNLEINKAYIKAKEEGKSKKEILKILANIEGVYVPAFYDAEYKDGKLLSISPNTDGVPEKIKKRIIKNLDTAYFPDKIIVPFLDVIHDRITLELFRGCIRGCRFCQAGMIYRPVREHSKEYLLDLAQKLIKNTGYEEISLSSLSTSDYTELYEFIENLLNLTEQNMINLSLPSLRIDNFSMELINKIQKVKKANITFAAEAGTQRMRDVINKGITEEEILNSAKIAFEGGARSIKIYFMIGLPYETEEDVAGIPDLAHKILNIYFAMPREKGERPAAINMSVSSFVPKPFTPFQWSEQNNFKKLQDKQKILVQNIKSKKITLSYHESKLAVLEGVFARGDRRLCNVLEEAYKKGCRMDSWSEYFSFDTWQEAFETCGISMDEYTRERSYDEFLPWDIIDIGVTKKFLINENEKAKKAEITDNCRKNCSGCGAACFKGGVCYE